MNQYSFVQRLAILLGCDIFLTIVDAYIPHELTPVRAAMALIELGFMAVTMAVAMRNVVEDY